MIVELFLVFGLIFVFFFLVVLSLELTFNSIGLSHFRKKDCKNQQKKELEEEK